MSVNLTELVRAKIQEIGVKEAASLFSVSAGTVSNWSSGKSRPSIEAAEIVMSMTDIPIAKEDYVEEELSQWKGRRLFIGLPAYRSINPDTHHSLFANYAKYGPEKIAMQTVKRTLIYEGRNILIDKAMKTDADTFIMWDDDMIAPCGNHAWINGNFGVNLPVDRASKVTISRLMSHDPSRGIVGVLYFGRHRYGKAQCASAFESDIENKKFHLHEYNDLKPERWVGTGIIMIRRWVIEKFRAAIDGGKWPDLKPVNETKWYGYFTPVKVGTGEDVSFGIRCGELGIQSYVDAGLECLHVGDFTYCSTNTKAV